MKSENKIKISVVMPAYNAAHLLGRVLPPLLEMRESGEVFEVLVVDDQSSDDTAQVARDMGATVMETPQNGGPGVARNLAAETAKGDVLWFVDSDVIAKVGGGDIVRDAFEDTDIHAVFGSYDADPGAPSWFSNYKNLLHRFHHQTANREASTFWSGCGAVRTQVFRDLKGFDTEIYRVPSIEDIELGYRIKNAGGRILVLPELLGKHLKVWSVRNAIFTDIFRRALPWSRLMISREGLTNDLNTGTQERICALLAGLFFLSIFTAPFIALGWVWPLVFLSAATYINRKFFSFMWKNGGFGFAMASILYHQVYYVYSATAFVWCLFEFHILKRTDRLHVP